MSVSTAAKAAHPLWERLGIPKPLILGYLGVLLFMIGDGVESNYLTPFLQDHNGMDVQRVGLLVTVYGIVVAVSSWLAAAFSDLWGPKRVMLIGATGWIVFEVIFLAFGVAADNETSSSSPTLPGAWDTPCLPSVSSYGSQRLPTAPAWPPQSAGSTSPSQPDFPPSAH